MNKFAPSLSTYTPLSLTPFPIRNPGTTPTTLLDIINKKKYFNVNLFHGTILSNKEEESDDEEAAEIDASLGSKKKQTKPGKVKKTATGR